MQAIFPLQYGFRLANGDFWSFYFSQDLIPWGKEFAQILGLKEDRSNNGNKFFFNSSRQTHYKELIGCTFPNWDAETYEIPYLSFVGLQTFLGLQIRHCPPLATYFCTLPEMDDVNHRLWYFHMMAALFPLYRKTMESGGLSLHAALIHHPDIGGIAILAPGGTGKTTCTQRIPSPWSPLSDDIMLAVRTSQAEYYAHPLPTWSNLILGRSSQSIWPIEKYIDLKGLFFLQQASTDKVIPLSKPDSAQWIYESGMQVILSFINEMTIENQRKQKNLIFTNACDLALQCPSFILKTKHDGCFWEEIEKVFLT
ncbi:MAG: SynChlorMet cassette protein ScmC [Candidatus Helarchaeota archaeon]|nr:SynChlorMet cassette protein ScmC [Candidatus Helarchaeota archaeon]